MRRTLLGLLATSFLGSVPALARSPAEDCARLKDAAIPHVEILVAKPVSGTFVEDFVADRRPRTYTGLKPFCRVRGISRPVPGSEIGFEVWLPASGWNGRLHMIGNGAYVSNISYKQMIARLDDGDVAVATDTGHQGSDLRFGWKHPERIADFGHRAVHESVLAAKQVVRAFYGRAANWSYFSGCSTGGYQGLSEAQRYPEDFDGIIAGAPGNNRTNLTLAFLWNYLANHRPNDDAHPILGSSELLLINRAVTKQCDKLDGVADGVVSDPRMCGFKIPSLACMPGDKPGSCLTGEQITAAQRIYDGPKDPRTGAQIYPGYPLGTEGVMSGASDEHPGWTGYWSETKRPDEPSRADMFRYWVFDDPEWNWWKFDWGADIDTMHARLAADFNATSTDLSAFSRGGGKMILFMGWQDPVGSPIEAINYYEDVRSRMGGDDTKTQAYLRLFMVPGMDHCAGGPGATNFSTATRDSTPPVRDARHDMLLALQAWVEQSRPPQSLIATRYATEDATIPADRRQIAFQRPICVYPAKPEYAGGPVNSAASYRCVSPPVPKRR
ncbi:tannase/feruloyl esterase family alpha/beta hydrolase [Sphingomonas sp. dw_22]|uniref:tannase/feruloyl esterase family alpha/beta hydrolase n=1 Tax=Sphingomonas sp. dw_22 TaxID=2721175 RepID=UPI001BD6403E|nr:tannase/feruloyl esterase family alpha/beta hydrolase [Sphingomonas sp. dw_22]